MGVKIPEKGGSMGRGKEEHGPFETKESSSLCTTQMR